MNNILTDLKSPTPIVKFRGFYNCVAEKNTEADVVNALISLKSDERLAVGRRICDYAKAVLHLLNVETYDGNDDDVLLLINTCMGQRDEQSDTSVSSSK